MTMACSITDGPQYDDNLVDLVKREITFDAAWQALCIEAPDLIECLLSEDMADTYGHTSYGVAIANALPNQMEVGRIVRHMAVRALRNQIEQDYLQELLTKYHAESGVYWVLDEMPTLLKVQAE